MKRAYFFFISLLFYQITSAQQWTFIGSALTSSVRGLYFENHDTGYAVGQDSSALGQIAKTFDGGTTWTSTSINQSSLLRAISFVNKDTGFACGYKMVSSSPAKGVVFKTEDAGTNWILIFSDTLEYFRAIDFISADTGFLGGASGTILKTVDGGNSWITDSIGETTSDVIQLHMADSKTGYAVCASGTLPFNPGYVFKTSDGGDTWFPVYYDANVGFLGLAVVDTLIVYAGGTDQTIIKTTDGGTTWDTVYTGLSGYAIRAAFAISATNIYMTDDGDAGTLSGSILHTNDGGTVWTVDTTIGTNGLYSIYFPTPWVGYSADLAGNVYKTEICQPLTPIDSIGGIQVLCAGDSMFYFIDTVAGATSYMWNIPGDAIITGGNGSTAIIVLFGDSSGNIVVVAMSDCDTIFASLAVIVHAFPDTPTITFTNDTLVSTPAATYQWYYNGTLISGATDKTYSPVQNGFYMVTVTNGADCETASLPFQVIGLGIADVTGNIGLEIFPNPWSTSAEIYIKGNSSRQKLFIADMQGKLLRQIVVSRNQKITVDKKDFPAGMYFISLLNDNNELIAKSKLVVQ